MKYSIITLVIFLLIGLVGCSSSISEEDIIELLSDYEDIKKSRIDIDNIESSKDEITVEATLDIKIDDVGYKTVVDYSIERDKEGYKIDDADIVDDKEYYPLTASNFGIRLDKVNFDVQDQTLTFNDKFKIEILKDDINIKNKPYYKKIEFAIIYEDEFSTGQGHGLASYSFDTKYGKWTIDEITQVDPIALEWKDGKRFNFHENDFYNFLDKPLYDLKIADDIDGIEISIDDDDEISIDNISDIIILPEGRAYNSIHVIANNGVIEIDTELSCYYEYDAFSNKWFIKNLTIDSVNEIIIPDLLVQWTGYHYDKDEVKKFVELIVDSKIGSSGDYIAKVNFYDSFEADRQLVKTTKAKITFSDGHVSDDIWIDFENRQPYEWTLILNGNELIGEYYYSMGYDYNEIKLKRIE